MTIFKKFKIGLFMGGASSEKEISLETGRHVYNSLDKSKFEVIPVFVDQQNHLWQIEEGLLWMNTCADVEAQLQSTGKRIYYEELPDTFDYVFSALHGKYGEECFPALFELYRIPNNTSGVLGGALGMDKGFQRKLLEANGLNVGKYVLLQRSQPEAGRPWAEKIKDQNDLTANATRQQSHSLGGLQAGNAKLKKEIVEEIGFPCIVKPTREGCSVAITKVNKLEKLEKAFEAAFAYDNVIMVEEYLEGKEVTTTVIEINGEPKALTPTETPYKGDFLSVEEKFLPGDATMITPPNLPKEDIEKIQREVLKAYKALRQKNCSRIDSIYKEGKLYILEPNSPPGMTPSTMVFHQAAEEGWTASEFFEKVIGNGLRDAK